jgi:predicted TIM-barrel fold metal-dependent hydrolase
MLSRRRFVKLAASSAAALAAGAARRLYADQPTASAGPGSAAAKTGAAKPHPGRYIDMHTHVGTVWYGNRELTAEGLVRWMDEHDIAKAVVLPLASPESSSFLLLTDSALKAAAQFPDRLIPFCSVDPRTSVGRGSVRDFELMIRAYVDKGARGFGEHKVGLDFDDPLMMRVYEACEKIGIPLLFHMDGIRGKDRPGLPRLEHALATFPKLSFIGHGPGWWASISGDVKNVDGYPQGPVQPGGAIDRLMDHYPNIFGELSAGSGANAISRDPKFGREFLIRRQDRIMFGTDYLQPGQDVPQFEVLGALDLPADVAAKVFRKNAEKMLKLS